MSRYLRLNEQVSFDGLHNLPEKVMTPMAVCRAYQLPEITAVRPVQLGVVALGGSYRQQEVDIAFDAYQLPRPEVSVNGQQGQDADDADATLEDIMDVELLAASYSYCTGQSAQVLLRYDDWSLLGLASALTSLVEQGCEVVSISWGWPESESTEQVKAVRSQACQLAADANCHVFVASGDYSLDEVTDSPTPEDPCCDPNVWGVGGTNLQLAGDGSIAKEAVWGDGQANGSGSGGGFARDVPTPQFQRGIVPGQYRGCPDSSAPGDPQAGFAIYANGKWQAGAGTSASAPFTAGFVAAILSSLPQPISQQELQERLYRNYRSAFNDITEGSNGAEIVSGWDPGSGCGSINGPGMYAAITG